MKIYLKDNVYDAAIERINWLFDEFEDVVVSFSGGKDSTVALNLTLQVAEERGRLPIKVLFLDQEAEWQMVRDYIRRVMDDPRVDPVWLQVPIRLFNATAPDEPWLKCWDPEKADEWMREKEPDSVHENTFGTETFGDMFAAWAKHEFGTDPACFVAGVRTEESPARFVGLTANATYKGRTWGKKLNAKGPQVTMYPLYDWSYTDVWKAIHDNGWDYCPVYDLMFQHGVKTGQMRVSNLHHETAVNTLYFLQEVEPDTWAKLTKRLRGIATVGQMKSEAFAVPKRLPNMFRDWPEYRDHLVENLISDPENREKFRAHFEKMDELYSDMPGNERLYRAQINTVLANDFHFTKLDTLERSADYNIFRRVKRGETINAAERAKFGRLLK